MRYIGSMTTYPQRFNSAITAIKSISNQTVSPQFLNINISEEDWDQAEKHFFKNASEAFSGEIRFNLCVNLKPANKIIPTAEKYRESIIVTFDDDIVYPEDRVERLMKKHQEYPENPIAFRIRKVTFDKKNTMPYGSWHISYGLDEPDKRNFPTSVSGSLYPANFFPESFFDISKYIELSHDNDDIWTYFHVLLKGSEFVKGGNEIVPPGVPGSQESALWKSNVSKGGNDGIIERLEKEYGTLYDLTGQSKK